MLQDALQLPYEFARNYRIIHYDLALPFDIERYCSQAILCSALLLQFIKDLPNPLAETFQILLLKAIDKKLGSFRKSSQRL